MDGMKLIFEIAAQSKELSAELDGLNGDELRELARHDLTLYAMLREMTGFKELISISKFHAKAGV